MDWSIPKEYDSFMAADSNMTQPWCAGWVVIDAQTNRDAQVGQAYLLVLLVVVYLERDAQLKIRLVLLCICDAQDAKITWPVDRGSKFAHEVWAAH